MLSYGLSKITLKLVQITLNFSCFFDQFLISHRGITQSLMSKFSLVKIQSVLTPSVYKQDSWTALTGAALTLVTVGSIPLELYRPH